MANSVQSPSSWVLPEDSHIVRIPTRPLEYRQSSFDELYDHHTVFYDCISLPESGRAIFLGPPFLNLADEICKMRVTALPSGRECAFSVRQLDRHSQLSVEIPPGTKSCVFASSLGEPSIPLSPDQSSIFNGKRVLFTTSRDNLLEWICDWIRFHRDIHGADAALIYDNNSSKYTPEDLCAHLQENTKIDAICVVRWPFKYGPQGYEGEYWDSDYCQLGAMEDARWRFLRTARSVLNVDVDEFVVTGGSSIFEMAEKSPTHYASFFGKWIVGLLNQKADLPLKRQRDGALRHFNLCYSPKIKTNWMLRPVEDLCPPKWALVPSKCPSHAQWKMHGVEGINQKPYSPSKVAYRHFREINTSWKYKRVQCDSFSARIHKLDRDLVKAYDKVHWDQ